MKKILIWVVSPILLAIACIGGTIAYLTDTDEEKNVVTVGEARIELREYQRDGIEKNQTDDIVEFENEKLLIPSVVDGKFVYPALAYDTAPTEDYVIWNADHKGETIIVDGNTGYTSPIWEPDDITNEIDKMVFVKNTGNCNVYVRICFAFEAGNYVWKSHFDRMVHLNKNETDWTWTWNDNLAEIDGTRCFIAWATYKHVLPAGEHTKISLSQIALDFSAINDHSRAFGKKYEVKAFAQGIQADGFASASEALAKGFDDTIPFKNCKFVEFTDLKTALHYLNADGETALTGNKDNPNTLVNSITFGLTKDHSAKVEGYNGVLVANLETQADFTAYAYYVPTTDGKNYDIYVLADNWKIYAPQSSKGLFSWMSALTKVDTKNLDFSYVTNMQGVFSGCGVLEELDVSNWNVTKKVRDISSMFSSCSALTTLDCSNWDVSGVTNMQYAFSGCKGLTNLDVSYWEVGKVSSFWNTFVNCSNLTTIPVDTWTWDGDPGQNATVDMRSMFSGCTSLTALDLSGWDVGKVTQMDHVFYNCTSLTSVNVGGWNVGNVSTITNMFHNCTSLTSVNVGGWNVGKVSKITNMFKNCYELSDLDLSSWNVSSVTNMAGMFSYCKALESLNVSIWNVSAVTDMSNMFEMCQKLVELDLSGWNTAKVKDSESMFANCTNLTTIYVGGNWQMNQVIEETVDKDYRSSKNMFANCTNLVGGNNTGYNASYVDKTYAIIDGGTSNPGYLTKKK